MNSSEKNLFNSSEYLEIREKLLKQKDLKWKEWILLFRKCLPPLHEMTFHITKDWILPFLGCFGTLPMAKRKYILKYCVLILVHGASEEVLHLFWQLYTLFFRCLWYEELRKDSVIFLFYLTKRYEPVKAFRMNQLKELIEESRNKGQGIMDLKHLVEFFQMCGHESLDQIQNKVSSIKSFQLSRSFWKVLELEFDPDSKSRISQNHNGSYSSTSSYPLVSWKHQCLIKISRNSDQMTWKRHANGAITLQHPSLSNPLSFESIELCIKEVLNTFQCWNISTPWIQHWSEKLIRQQWNPRIRNHNFSSVKVGFLSSLQEKLYLKAFLTWDGHQSIEWHFTMLSSLSPRPFDQIYKQMILPLTKFFQYDTVKFQVNWFQCILRLMIKWCSAWKSKSQKLKIHETEFYGLSEHAFLYTLNQLFEYLDRIFLVQLIHEKDHLLLMLGCLDVFEWISSIPCRYEIPLVFPPSSALMYRCILASNAYPITRMLGILYNLKQSFEWIKTYQSTNTTSLCVGMEKLSLFNSYLWDITNLLWKNTPEVLMNPKQTKIKSLIFNFSSQAQKSVFEETFSVNVIKKAFSISSSMAFIGFTKRFYQVLENPDLSDYMKQYLDLPVSLNWSFLSQDHDKTIATESSIDFQITGIEKIAFLVYLKSLGMDHLELFFTTFMSSLQKWKEKHVFHQEHEQEKSKIKKDMEKENQKRSFSLNSFSTPLVKRKKTLLND